MTLASRRWRGANLASVNSETRSSDCCPAKINGNLRGRFTLTMAALLCPASFMIFLIIGDRGFKDTLLWGQGLGQDSRSIVMLAPEFDSLSASAKFSGRGWFRRPFSSVPSVNFSVAVSVVQTAATSMKSGLFETLQHMVMRCLRAEL